jgi:hypothetical protein
MDHADFPWRPLGLLLVGKGLLSRADLELALGEQRRTGRLLGQILVSRGFVTSLALTQALAEQHGVELRSTAGEDEGGKQEPSPAPTQATSGRAWRPLGKILVTKGFLSEMELDHALAEQERRPDRRLGEILVAHGSLTGPALALALAEQHGLDLGPQESLDTRLETIVRPSTPAQPVYRVYEVEFEPTYRPGSMVWESANFLEAADFACEFVERQSPKGLEIQRTDGRSSETVWTYSESRAAAESSSRKNLVQTFGYDPMRWNTRGQFGSQTKT